MKWPVRVIQITQGVHQDHVALDFAADEGDPVRAAVTGTVVMIGNNPNYVGGLFVVIQEDRKEGWCYYTGHHSKNCVKLGQHVKEGQKIAEIGSTGEATGPHTHFQVRSSIDGPLLNPWTVFEQRQEHITEPPKEVIEMVTMTGLGYLYRSLLGGPVSAYGKKNYLGKVTFDKAEAGIRNSPSYKAKIAAFKAGKANAKAHLPRDLMKVAK